MTNASCLNAWQKQHPDKAIVHNSNWLPQGPIWILRLNHQQTEGKVIQMSTITTWTPRRLAVHFCYRISPTGGASQMNHPQSTRISPMRLATYLLSYQMVLEWRPVFPFAKTLLAGDSAKPLARLIGQKSYLGSLLEPMTKYQQIIVQHSILQKLKRTWKWRNRRRKDNSPEWPRSMTVWRCGRAAKVYVQHRRHLALKTSKWLLWDTFQIPKRSSKHPGQTFNMMVRLHFHCKQAYLCHQLCLQRTSLEDELKYWMWAES